MTLFDDVFSGSQGVAKQLVGKFGFPVTLRRETKTFDISLSKNTVSNKDYTVKMTPPQPYKRSRMTDSSIEAGDLSTMIAADGLAITPNPTTDKIVYNSTVWQVVAVDPIVSGLLTAAYKLQIRQ